MKKLLIIALLLTPFFGFSQTTTKPIDSFLGIKFGSSKAVVLAAMKAKGATLNKTNTDPTALIFNDLKLGHREVDQLTVDFVNNQACQVAYYFSADAQANVPSYYQDLVNDFTNVYGKGQSTKDYTDPYKEGESAGDELLGLSVSKIKYKTIWLDANQNAISAEIISEDSNMNIILIYQNSALFDQYLKKQQEKNTKDF